MRKNVGRRKYGAADITLAIAAAVFGVLHIIVFYGYVFINKDSISLIQSNAYIIVSIVLTLVSFALLTVYTIGIGKSPLLAAVMLTNAVRIIAGYISGIISYRQNQIEFKLNIGNIISMAIMLVFAFAGILLLVNPAKIRIAALSAIIALVLNAVMLIISICQNIEAYREYRAAIEYLNLNEFPMKTLLNSAISSSFYYLSQILMCLSIVMISRKFRTANSAPKSQPTSAPASE